MGKNSKKKLVFSVKANHCIIRGVVKKLQDDNKIDLVVHDPTQDFFELETIPQFLEDIDLLVVKVRNDCSIDLLHLAKIYKIPTLHNFDVVSTCKNKISLDYTLRKIFNDNSKKLSKFMLPKSWNHSLMDVSRFKKWASTRLPIVIKSHNQHDKYNRFNFLVQKIDEVDKFCEKYKNFLYYDVYIQKFIECDGFERKVYVIGDKVFGIIRENPIYIYLREKPEKIDVGLIKRERFKVTEDILQLSKILSHDLGLKIFGFDLIQPINQNKLFLVDLNDFPSFKGIPNIENEMKNYIMNYVLAL